MKPVEELVARTEGVSPAKRRLQLGLPAIILRDDRVVKLLPDGTETDLGPAYPERDAPE